MPKVLLSLGRFDETFYSRILVELYFVFVKWNSFALSDISLLRVDRQFFFINSIITISWSYYQLMLFVWLLLLLLTPCFLFISLFTQTYLTSKVYLRETILNGLTLLRFIITLAISLFVCFSFPKGLTLVCVRMEVEWWMWRYLIGLKAVPGCSC